MDSTCLGRICCSKKDYERIINNAIKNNDVSLMERLFERRAEIFDAMNKEDLLAIAKQVGSAACEQWISVNLK